jgi:RNA polymerase sigma factor (sigma-70 family)
MEDAKVAVRGTHPILRHLRRAVLRAEGTEAADGQLLERFIANRDPAAFEALLRRHGPMVLGVCRRALGNPHDADDAFQATFLVLARKAASVSPREKVGNFLYGVARTTALRAKAANAKRRLRERPLTDLPEPQARPRDGAGDLRPLLDEELSRLPAKYRLLLVLCDLEGRARKDVARQLGMPEGTLSSRLTTARGMLAKRLARHGLAVSGGSLAAWSGTGTAAGLPAAQVGAVVEAALHVAAGKTAAGLVSVHAALLAKGVLKIMLISRLEAVAAAVLAMGLFAFGGWALTRPLAAAGQVEGEAAGGKAAPRTATVARPASGGRQPPVPGGNRGLTPPARQSATEEVRDEVKLLVEQNPEDYATLFNTMLEVLGDSFEVAYANRYEGRIESAPLLDPRRTPPAVRRLAIFTVVAEDDGGYRVGVRVLKESRAETAGRPPRPLLPPAVEAEWAPAGRDMTLEQVLLRRLVEQYRKERAEGSRQRPEEDRTEGDGPNSIRLRNVHLNAVNPADRTLSVVTLSGRPTTILGLPVAKEARIKVKKGSTLADLKIGMRVILQLGVEDGRLVVTEIRQMRSSSK